MPDLLLDDDLDLLIEGGDFVVATAEEERLQRAQLIMATSRGSWKQSPLLGVGAARLREAPLDAELRREIELQLRADGLEPKAIDLQPEGIRLEF